MFKIIFSSTFITIKKLIGFLSLSLVCLSSSVQAMHPHAVSKPKFNKSSVENYVISIDRWATENKCTEENQAIKEAARIVMLDASKNGFTVNNLCIEKTAPEYYQPPLIMAAQNGHDMVVRILIAAGANINYQNNYGTALHHAAKYGWIPVVKILLEAKADISIKNKWEKTAYDSTKTVEIKQLILDAQNKKSVELKDLTTFLMLKI